MVFLNINVDLLPIKAHYFLFDAGEYNNMLVLKLL